MNLFKKDPMDSVYKKFWSLPDKMESVYKFIFKENYKEVKNDP